MQAGKAYREDNSLKKGEAQIYQLQQQVDELRRLLREQVSRQHLVEENWKQAESRIGQLTEQQAKQTAEHVQQVQVRSLEEHRIKQDVAELQVRINEPIKPIRDLRAQLQEILESRRRDVEQFSFDKNALEKLSNGIRDLQAQFTRYDAISKDLRRVGQNHRQRPGVLSARTRPDAGCSAHAGTGGTSAGRGVPPGNQKRAGRGSAFHQPY